MRILITCSWYFPQVIGGAETRIRDICRELSKEHDVVVYCCNNQNEDHTEFVDGIKVVRQRFHRPKIRLFKRLSEYYQSFRNGLRIPDDFDLSISTSFAYTAAIKKKYPVKKIIFLVTAFVNTLTDLNEPGIGIEEWLCRRLDYHFFRHIEKKAFITASTLVVASKSSHEDMVREYKMDFPNIKIVPMGVDLMRFIMRRNRAVLDRWNIQRDRFVILTVSRLVKLKNISLLIKSMKYIDEAAICLIVGDGPEKSALQRLAKDLAVDDRTIFVGEVLDPSEYYACADVFVIPSIKEFFSCALLEAMASGIPCIGLKRNISDEIIVSSEEIITEDVGFCVENDEIALAKAINILKDNGVLRQEMSINARRRAEEKYSMEKLVRKILTV